MHTKVGKKLLSIVVGVVVSLVFSVNTSSAVPAVGKLVCDASPATTTEIIMKTLATFYNIFPVRIGGVQIMTFEGLEDFNDLSGLPICLCGFPIPRIGVTFSFWEPFGISEVVKMPGCSPTLGMDLPIVPNPAAVGSGGANGPSAGKNGLQAAQVHWLKVSPFAILNLFTDLVCLSATDPLDLAYVSELDPTWQADALADIQTPESILVANPIAQAACGVDAVAASAGFPLDPLYWCMGSWGNVFPLSQSETGVSSPEQASAQTGRLIFKLQRDLVIWGSIGKLALCGMYPMPIWIKSQYNTFPIYPIGFPLRFPIGRTGFLWDEGQNVPGVNRHNWVFLMYRKRDCCAF